MRFVKMNFFATVLVITAFFFVHCDNNLRQSKAVVFSTKSTPSAAASLFQLFSNAYSKNFLQMQPKDISRSTKADLKSKKNKIKNDGKDDYDDAEDLVVAEEEDTISVLSYDNAKYYASLFVDNLVSTWNTVWDIQEDDSNTAESAIQDNSNITHKSSDVMKSKKKVKRGHKIHKLIALIKLLILGLVLDVAIKLLLKAILVMVKWKMLWVAKGHLLLSAIRLFMESRKKKLPPKMIYYEHANHEHHYDAANPYEDHHFHDGDGAGFEEPAFKHGIWSRDMKPPFLDSTYDVYQSGYQR